MNAKQVLIGVLVFAFVLRFVNLFEFSVYFYDEALYSYFSKVTLIESPVLATFYQPPVFYYLEAPFFLFNEIIFLRVLPLICGVVSVYLAYLIMSKLFDEKTGLITSIILCFNSLHVFYSRIVLQDVLMLLLMEIIILLLLNKNRKHLLIAGLLMGLTFHLKYTSIYFNLIILFFLFFYNFKPKDYFYFFLPEILIILFFFIPQILLSFNAPSSIYSWSNYWEKYGAENQINYDLTNLLPLPGSSSLITAEYLFLNNPISFILLIWFLFKKNFSKNEKLLIIWVIILFVLLGLNDKNTDRYFFFQTCGLIPLTGLISLKIQEFNESYKKISLILILGFFLVINYFLIFNPVNNIVLTFIPLSSQVNVIHQGLINELIPYLNVLNSSVIISNNAYLLNNYLNSVNINLNQIVVNCPPPSAEYLVVFNSTVQDLSADFSVYDDSRFFQFNKSFTYKNSQAFVYEVVSNDFCSRSLSLPLFPALTLKDLLEQ